jgi:hypothetical protein
MDSPSKIDHPTEVKTEQVNDFEKSDNIDESVKEESSFPSELNQDCNSETVPRAINGNNQPVQGFVWKNLPKILTTFLKSKPALLSSLCTIFIFGIVVVPAGIVIGKKFQKMQKSLQKTREINRIESLTFEKEIYTMRDNLSKMRDNYNEEMKNVEKTNENEINIVKEGLAKEKQGRTELSEKITSLEGNVKEAEKNLESLSLLHKDQKSSSDNLETNRNSLDSRVTVLETENDLFKNEITTEMDTFGIRMDSRFGKISNSLSKDLNLVESKLTDVEKNLNKTIENFSEQNTRIDKELDSLTTMVSSNADKQDKFSEGLTMTVNNQISNLKNSLNDQLQEEILPKFQQLEENLDNFEKNYAKSMKEIENSSVLIQTQLKDSNQKLAQMESKTAEEFKLLNQKNEEFENLFNEQNENQKQKLIEISKEFKNDTMDLNGKLENLEIKVDTDASRSNEQFKGQNTEHQKLFNSLSDRININRESLKKHELSVAQSFRDLSQTTEEQKNNFDRKLDEHSKEIKDFEKNISDDLIKFKGETKESFTKNDQEVQTLQENLQNQANVAKSTEEEIRNMIDQIETESKDQNTLFNEKFSELEKIQKTTQNEVNSHRESLVNLKKELGENNTNFGQFKEQSIQRIDYLEEGNNANKGNLDDMKERINELSTECERLDDYFSVKVNSLEEKQENTQEQIKENEKKLTETVNQKEEQILKVIENSISKETGERKAGQEQLVQMISKVGTETGLQIKEINDLIELDIEKINTRLNNDYKSHEERMVNFEKSNANSIESIKDQFKESEESLQQRIENNNSKFEKESEKTSKVFYELREQIESTKENNKNINNKITEMGEKFEGSHSSLLTQLNDTDSKVKSHNEELTKINQFIVDQGTKNNQNDDKFSEQANGIQNALEKTEKVAGLVEKYKEENGKELKNVSGELRKEFLQNLQNDKVEIFQKIDQTKNSLTTSSELLAEKHTQAIAQLSDETTKKFQEIGQQINTHNTAILENVSKKEKILNERMDGLATNIERENGDFSAKMNLIEGKQAKFVESFENYKGENTKALKNTTIGLREEFKQDIQVREKEIFKIIKETKQELEKANNLSAENNSQMINKLSGETTKNIQDLCKQMNEQSRENLDTISKLENAMDERINGLAIQYETVKEDTSVKMNCLKENLKEQFATNEVHILKVTKDNLEKEKGERKNDQEKMTQRILAFEIETIQGIKAVNDLVSSEIEKINESLNQDNKSHEERMGKFEKTNELYITSLIKDTNESFQQKTERIEQQIGKESGKINQVFGELRGDISDSKEKYQKIDNKVTQMGQKFDQSHSSLSTQIINTESQVKSHNEELTRINLFIVDQKANDKQNVQRLTDQADQINEALAKTEKMAESFENYKRDNGELIATKTDELRKEFVQDFEQKETEIFHKIEQAKQTLTSSINLIEEKHSKTIINLSNETTRQLQDLNQRMDSQNRDINSNAGKLHKEFNEFKEKSFLTSREMSEKIKNLNREIRQEINNNFTVLNEKTISVENNLVARANQTSIEVKSLATQIEQSQNNQNEINHSVKTNLLQKENQAKTMETQIKQITNQQSSLQAKQITFDESISNLSATQDRLEDEAQKLKQNILAIREKNSPSRKEFIDERGNTEFEISNLKNKMEILYENTPTITAKGLTTNATSLATNKSETNTTNNNSNSQTLNINIMQAPNSLYNIPNLQTEALKSPSTASLNRPDVLSIEQIKKDNEIFASHTRPQGIKTKVPVSSNYS